MFNRVVRLFVGNDVLFKNYVFRERLKPALSVMLQSFADKRFFTARRNARIASAVLATAIPSVRPSVCLSVRLSVTRRYCVKTTARSTVQFSLLDRKMCLVL